MLKSLFDATTLYSKELPFDPDFDLYFALEQQGKSGLFTARRGDIILGFNSFIVTTTFLRRSVITATHDVLFVRPSERGHWLGLKLIRGAEEGLARSGARLIRYAPVSFTRLEPLLLRADYLKNYGDYEKMIG